MFDDIMAPVQSTTWIQNDTYCPLRKDAVFNRQGVKNLSPFYLHIRVHP